MIENMTISKISRYQNCDLKIPHKGKLGPRQLLWGIPSNIQNRGKANHSHKLPKYTERGNIFHFFYNAIFTLMPKP